MANSIIEQEPLYNVMPVGQEIIFVVSNDDAVLNQTRVKFVAEVHISTTNPNLNTTTDLIGTFKTTPNNAGVGMFDLRSIVENYVKADNMAADGSSYKTVPTTSNRRHPVHLIDKYSLNLNTWRFMGIRFAVEFLGATDVNGDQDDNIVRIGVGTEVDTGNFNLFNGYIKYTDTLLIGTGGNETGEFGYDIFPFFLTNTDSRFLTNAPNTQYANLEDYGTMSFLTGITDTSRINLVYKNSAGVGIGAENVDLTAANGAYTTQTDTNTLLLYFGCFPANLRNTSSTFNNLVTAGTIQGGSIEVTAFSPTTERSQTYTIDLNCPTAKGYEPIRLDSFKGGKKAFRVNSTERISMNTGFVAEDENVMFEELINSPEVYLLDGFQDDSSSGTKVSSLNKYVTPVRLTTSSFTRKTSANDRLLQYTFEIEKSKTLRTQSV